MHNAASCTIATVFKLIILALCLWPAWPIPASAAWPTTRFEAHVGNPFVGEQETMDFLGREWLEFQDLVGGPSEEAIAEIERALSEAGQWLEQKGFPPPIMDQGVNEAGQPVYRFYLCTADLGQKAWESVIGRG
ncbi:MAG: hypothetical protein HKN58_00120, partial [Xanthomonadales bacterium]|nr:hypothetical protein [Xanthomonadales bacterium]